MLSNIQLTECESVKGCQQVMANMQKHIQYLKMNMWEVTPYGYQSFVIQLTCHAVWSSQSQQCNPDTFFFTVVLSATLMFTCILAYKLVCFVMCNKLLYFSLSKYVADILQTLMEQDFWKKSERTHARTLLSFHPSIGNYGQPNLLPLPPSLIQVISCADICHSSLHQLNNRDGIKYFFHEL